MTRRNATRHANPRARKHPCGTPNYARCGCECAACKAVTAARQADYRWRKRYPAEAAAWDALRNAWKDSL